MGNSDQVAQHQAVDAPPGWTGSEERSPSIDELVAQFVLENEAGDAARHHRHGIGPGSVVMALAGAGFGGPINPLCLQHLVELARYHGIPGMVERVSDDTGLTFIPTAKWWFCQAMLV